MTSAGATPRASPQPSAVRPERSPTPAPSSAPPPSGAIDERGTIRHDSVRVARWSVTGTAKVTGSVEVGTADVRGTLAVGGRLSADRLRSRGNLEVEGPVEVRGLFSSRGALRLAGSAHATDLDLDGTARFAGAVTVDRTCSVRGVLHAPALAVGVLRVVGAAHVPGEVRALSVDASFREASELGRIEARTVRLRGRLPNLVDKVFFHERTVVVERIEAESVDLAGVEVGLVRAQKVVLGRGCHVTAVEGTIVAQHSSSTVGPESKSPPPYGLRR
jgi:cytoskeletal protein CcmA (bactofilin family)